MLIYSRYNDKVIIFSYNKFGITNFQTC